MVNATKGQLEMSILSKVQASIDSDESLKKNSRLVSAVNGGDALGAVHELRVATPDCRQQQLRRKFVSRLSERYRDAMGLAAQDVLSQVIDEANQLLQFAPSDVA